MGGAPWQEAGGWRPFATQGLRTRWQGGWRVSWSGRALLEQRPVPAGPRVVLACVGVTMGGMTMAKLAKTALLTLFSTAIPGPRREAGKWEITDKMTIVKALLNLLGHHGLHGAGVGRRAGKKDFFGKMAFCMAGMFRLRWTSLRKAKASRSNISSLRKAEKIFGLQMTEVQALMGPSPPSTGPDTTLHIFDRNNLQHQGDWVTLTFQQLALLHDTVMRAMRAAEQADRLCTAAAAAFRQEALNLRAAGTALLGYLSG